MNQKFLEHYNNELFYIRSMAEEFAEQNPQIAQQLNLREFDSPDPYIERLLEGFAFLAARVNIKLDSEFPRFTQTLINNIYPQYLMPTPSISAVKFVPDYKDQSLTKGIAIPRNSILETQYRNQFGTASTFKTAHDVTLWPVNMENAAYKTDFLPETGSFLNLKHSPQACLSLEFSSSGGNFNALPVDHFDFHLHNSNINILMDLYENIFSDLIGAYIEYETNTGEKYQINLPNIVLQLQPLGLDDNHSLLPYDVRTFQSYRLLREYFANPKRFLFFRIDKLSDAMQQIEAEKFHLVLIMKSAVRFLEESISEKNFSLYATPIINLFEKKLERVTADQNKTEYLITADNTKPRDFEVLSIIDAKGFNSSNKETVTLRPFYQATGYDKYYGADNVYYSIHKTFISEADNNREGTNSYISIKDIFSFNRNEAVSELDITALCSNRMLPQEIPIGTKSKYDFNFKAQYPLASAKFIEKPTPSNYACLDCYNDWTIINHLRLNYLSLLNSDSNTGADVLKTLLNLYANPKKQSDQRQIEGIKKVSLKRVIKKIQGKEGVCFGSGIELELFFEDENYSDTGFLILAHIIHKLVESSIPINSVLETTVHSASRGEIIKWKSMNS